MFFVILCSKTYTHKHILYFREGFSLLLHGVGSKRNLINDFHSEIIADHPTLIVNGFFPSLTLKDVRIHTDIRLLNRYL